MPLHDAVVVRNYLETGKEWGVFIPCDNRKEATGAAQFLNSMIREGEAKEQKNGELVLPPDYPPPYIKAGEPSDESTAVS